MIYYKMQLVNVPKDSEGVLIPPGKRTSCLTRNSSTGKCFWSGGKSCASWCFAATAFPLFPQRQLVPISWRIFSQHRFDARRQSCWKDQFYSWNLSLLVISSHLHLLQASIFRYLQSWNESKSNFFKICSKVAQNLDSYSLQCLIGYEEMFL